ncbi:hypothetical protein MMC27_007852 [Xylographa pallens]|nr:hypothetical protein [Xylographa pallens]
MSTNLRVLQIHWLPFFEDFRIVGSTAWDVVAAIDASEDGGLPPRTPEFWEWVMRVLQIDDFPDAPAIQNDLPVWRYVVPASDYVSPVWKPVKHYEPPKGTDERALKDRWHSYMMYVRFVYGRTYDEILARYFRGDRSIGGFAAEGVELTDEFLDWAMWELRNKLQDADLERGFPSPSGDDITSVDYA